MKIRFSKRRLFSNLVLGILFSIMSSLRIFEGTASYFTYFQLLLGLLMIGTYFFEMKYQYLSIKNDVLTKNNLIKKTVQLDKIEQVQTFPGRIKLASSEKNLSINTSIIDKESINDLYRVLGSLELEPQKNPFTGWSKAES